ncbi:MAG: DUF2807 domain-containing protein [Flavobacteriaceae bacterium]|nr:DUF2807 domain-containing protein [Flavobacteriaceae bacterium]
MKKLIITSIILTLSFSVQAQSWWNTKKVRGNGKVTTEIRKTTNYSGLSLAGNFDVELVKGTTGNITLKGEENLLKYIETKVKRGVLKIKVKKGYRISRTQKILITVPYKKLDKVSLAGAGDIYSNSTINSDNIAFSVAGSGNIDLAVDAQKVKISVAGSGDIKLKGKTVDLKCSVAGSGDINAYGLKTNNTYVSIAGSGNIKTTVSNKIKASVVGSGSIYYKGKPDKIDSSAIGSGKVIDRN